jgi:hypothetical protein
MKVIHFSVTPLAGAPLRIVRALQAGQGIQARLVTLDPAAYGPRRFEGDLRWNEDREQALALMEDADLFHFHHWFDFKHNPFGVDFTAWSRRGVQFVRQFHSHPAHGQFQGFAARDIVTSSTPQLVLAQYHERYYPWARPVPNPVDLEDALHVPLPPGEAAPRRVVFSPSNTSPVLSCTPATRWSSKGCPEVTALLGEVAASRGGTLEVVTNTPHLDCLRRKQGAWAALDDLVTGSYHLSALESAAQGVPTLCWLDGRTQQAVRELTGASDLPWLNCSVLEAPHVVAELLDSPRLRDELGRDARRWMERHWSVRQTSLHFKRAYEDILHDPTTFNRPRFDPDDPAEAFRSTGMPDGHWLALMQGLRAALSGGHAPMPVDALCALEQRLAESESRYAALKRWTDELQRGKDWLEGQYLALADVESRYAALKAWTDELQRGKDWLEGQYLALTGKGRGDS